MKAFLNKRGIDDITLGRQNKFIVTLIFVFCAASNVVLLTTPPIDGYEISIYTALPAYYWIAIITSLILCIILIIRSSDKIHFNLAFLGILTNYTSLIFLSFIRGYFLPVDGDWDVYHHIAQANYIESEGHLTHNNYPIIHIMLMIIRVMGIMNESMTVSSTLALYHILYLVTSVYAVEVIFSDREMRKFCFLLFIPFLLGKFHIVLMPFQCALVLLLLFICISFKAVTTNTNKRYQIPLIIIGTTLVFFHPLVFIMALISMTISIVGCYIYPHVAKDEFMRPVVQGKRLFIHVLLLTFVIYLTWLMISGQLSLPVRSISDFLLDDQEKNLSLINYGKTIITSESMELTYKISRFMITYGTLAVYLLIGFLGLLTVFYRIFNRSSDALDVNILLLGTAALLFGMILLTGSFIIGEIERALGFFIILTPILCGIFFSELLAKRRCHKLIVSALLVIVISTSTLGIFDLYYSPSNTLDHPSPMVSYADKSGIEFTLIHMDKNIPIIRGINVLRLWIDYVYGPNQWFRLNIRSTADLPTRLGYTIYSYIGENYKSDSYLWINERLKQSSLERSYNRYQDEDFEHLSNDRSADKLYSSDAFEVWFVNTHNF